MNDELNNVVPDSSNLDVGLSGIASQLEDLNSNLLQPELVLVDGVEKTQTEILVDLLEVMKPDEKSLELQATEISNQSDLLTSLNENIISLNESIEVTSALQLEEMQGLTLASAEGSLMVSLSVVIAFGVYMFWSQISKW